MQYRKIMILNGNIPVPYYIYKCKNCECDVEESHPREERNGEIYCWDCAFIKGFISENKYLSLFCSLDMARAVVHDGKIFVGIGKFPWERTSRDRGCKEYREWRNKVFQRDNFICQMCGKVGGQLNAHHVKSYKDYPKLRYSVQNGLTLCVKCHRKIHSKGGGSG